jgi:hypothetical protein
MPAERDHLVNLRHEFLWRFSKHWLKEDDVAWADAHADTLNRVSVRPMNESLSYVWMELTANVRVLAGRSPAFDRLAEALDAAARPFAEANERTVLAQDELLKALAAADVWPVAVKGAAMRGYVAYPQAMNDLDVVTRDLDQTWCVLDVARSLGYPLNRIKLVSVGDRVPGPSRYHGYTNLYRREGGGSYVQADWDLGRVRTLDLHVGRFYGCGDAVLVTDLFERATRRHLGAVEALVPAPEDLILVEFVHMIRHGTLSMRTLNRVGAVLEAVPDLDIGYIASEVTRNDVTIPALAVTKALEREATGTTVRVAAALRGQLSCNDGGWRRPLVRHLAGRRRVEKYGAGSIRSVLTQTQYLAAAYTHQFGPANALFRPPSSFARMLRDRKVYPRAYRRWSNRRTGWLGPRNDAIMLVAVDTTPWRVDGVVADGERVEQSALLVDRGRETEALLTPIGTFISTAYDGTVRAELAEAVAVSLRRFDHLRPSATSVAAAPEATERTLN